MQMAMWSSCCLGEVSAVLIPIPSPRLGRPPHHRGRSRRCGAWVVSRADIDVLAQGPCEGEHVSHLDPDEVG